MDRTQQVQLAKAANPEFSPSFQYQLMAHMARDSSFFRTNCGWLRADHFSLLECQLVLTTLYDFYTRFNQQPSLTTMELHLTDEILPAGGLPWTPEDMPNLCNLLAHVHAVGRLEPDYYQSKLQTFIQEVEVNDLMKEAQLQGFGNQSTLVMDGLERIRMENANRGGIEMDSASEDDPELIITREEQVRIPTGLRRLDAHLSGGLAPTEVGMVTACTGVGKSNALTNFILSGILAGNRGLLITTELPKKKLKRRFQAMSMGIVADYFKAAVEDWPEEILYRYQHFLDPNYKHRGMDTFVDYSKREHTIPEIEQAIIQWKERVKQRHGEAEAQKCRLVCIDWLDHVSATGLGLSNNARTDEKLTALPKQFGFIARRTDTAIWTATQGTREADGQEVLQLKHTSGAYHKNDALDVSVGLGRVNDDGTYNDVENHWEVGNEDDDESPPCDRDLVLSLMKGRESAKAGAVSFKCYQGSSLRFWDNKSQMDQCASVAKDDPSQYVDQLANVMGNRRRKVIVE